MSGIGVQEPLVSCIMPTFNRVPFVRMAVGWFSAQDYPNKELVVVDDGTEPAAELLRGCPGVTYIPVGGRMTIGAKRNLACEHASGDVILQWDDDDWYGPSRISRQVLTLTEASAEVTGIAIAFVYDLVADRFWAPTGATGFLPQPSIAYATLGFTRAIWRACGGYPDLSIGEDVGFLQRAAGRGGRVYLVEDADLFVHVRHGANSWRFQPGEHLRGPWTEAGPPAFMPAEARAGYRSLRDSA
jgi:glycosyltransferase involved in cell wall biosynthesis